MPHLPPKTEVVTEFEASAEQLRRAEEVERKYEELMLRRAGQSVSRYHDAPERFVMECIKWPKGEAPTAYQLRNLARLQKAKRLAVRGPHGLGKTAQNAWVVLWFALTREAAGEDWKIITTASAWRQLTHYLWPEIRKWSRQLDWKRLGREPFTREEMMQMKLRLEHGEAFAVACEDPSTIEGAHADQMLYIYDEAKSIPAETFDASEGAFSGAGEETKMDAFALASSTPGEPQGRFYEIHSRKEGLLDWHAVHVSLEDAKKAKRISDEWARERGKQWGKTSAVYINRVLGNFAASEEDGVIPLDWLEKANQRWLKLQDENWPELGLLTGVSADIARSGGDKTVLALRHGRVLRELRRLNRTETEDTMQATGHIAALLMREEGSRPAIVDVIGIGAGVVDRLRESGHTAFAFNASEKSLLKDSSGELSMVNCRSAAWWNLRDMLEPNSGHDLAIPPDDKLTGDLTAPKWKITSGGKIQVEAKDDIRKRIGRSTDDGDAVVMAFYLDMGVSFSAPIFSTAPSRWAAVAQRAGG